MINLYQAQIENLFIHKVGNQSKGENLLVSMEPTVLTDELMPLLKEFFFKPFREKEERYFKFQHEVDLEYNELHESATEIFKDSRLDTMLLQSKDIVEHLYAQSTHPHIKSGEVYICHITDVVIDNVKTDAVGIFKSEVKMDFLQFAKQQQNLQVILSQGVDLTKLDKGCIIFNHEAEEGYKVLSVDNNRYDTKYWLENFLNVVEFEDSSFYTKKYLKFCQDFAKEVVFPAEDKKEEVMFMNRAVNHFAKNDDFMETNFLNEVIENPDLVPEFNNYKTEKGPKYKIEDVSAFPINNTAVKEMRGKFKKEIKLDTGITLKLDFVNPESANKFLEKGWDEERQMYYYLSYFNKEER